ncbi:MerR family transcriptional regulator [Nonomuraea fuscirosea]|uniref:MerR family transcriptional regulator n=1 Tax=Nonomuraea fuscirosea TaxID=1291556 RepID=UPI001FE73951|nr:MerR family transcriptional regulator [Nonomuraea fuscirosea]
MNDVTGLYTIGQPARRTGLRARTIRFRSDSGVLPPAGRSPGGYRLYDAEAVVRLGLVRTLRDLGLGLDAIRRVLERRATLSEVADLHARALDAEIRTLEIRRSAAGPGPRADRRLGGTGGSGGRRELPADGPPHGFERRTGQPPGVRAQLRPLVIEHAGAALARAVAPESAGASAILARSSPAAWLSRRAPL